MEGVSFQPRDTPIGPVAVPLGSGALISGLDAALVGQRPGAKLRVLVPPDQGYVDGAKQEPAPPTWAAKRQVVNHARESLLFEVQVLKVLPPAQQ